MINKIHSVSNYLKKVTNLGRLDCNCLKADKMEMGQAKRNNFEWGAHCMFVINQSES